MLQIKGLCIYLKYLDEQRATNRLPPLTCKNTWRSWGKMAAAAADGSVHAERL